MLDWWESEKESRGKYSKVMKWYEKMLGMEDAEPTARAERKRAGLPANEEQPIRVEAPVGVMPEDIRTESAVGKRAAVASEQSSGKPEGNTLEAGNEDKYKDLRSVIDRLQKAVDEAEVETPEDKAKREKREKRKMFLAGIGDAANAMHQAYSYGRGIKAMPDVNLTDKARKEIREDEEWRKKNHDRIMTYNTKIAELNRQVNALENADAALEARNKEYDRRVKKDEAAAETARIKAEAYSEYQKSLANKNNEMAAYWRAKWEALEAGKSNDEALKEAKIAQANAAANASNALAEQRRNGGDEVVEAREQITYDKYGNKPISKTTTTTKKKGGGTSSNGNAGNGKTGALLPNRGTNKGGTSKGGSLLPNK